MKKEQPSKVYVISEDSTMVAEDEVPYRTTQEILAGVEEAFMEVKMYREGKLQLKTLEEALDELPD